MSHAKRTAKGGKGTGGKAFLPGDQAEEKPKQAPVMGRSRNQLASAYAPGSFFTFEGGRGACLAIPDRAAEQDRATISEPTRRQIIMRLAEAWQSWFTRAQSAQYRGNSIDPRQCIDEFLLRQGVVTPKGEANLAFVNPVHMAYVPAPLTFVCNHCGFFKAYGDPLKLIKDRASFDRHQCRSAKHQYCQWRQLDVIFVHPSGEWSAATPGRWEWNSKTQEPNLAAMTCAMCHGDEFFLHTQSPRIGQWSFQCANKKCNHQRDAWRVHDLFTTEILQDRSDKMVAERRMEPISYRASAAYYAQSEQFIIFSEDDHELLGLLQEGQHSKLANFLAKQFGFLGSELTMEQKKERLLQGGHEKAWKDYERQERFRARFEQGGDHEAAAEAEQACRDIEASWSSGHPPLIEPSAQLPAMLTQKVQLRAEFSSRYDPFVLAVEHEALRKHTLSKGPDASGRAPFVRFRHLDDDLAPKSESQRASQEDETAQLMGRLGLAEAGLIRDFQLCRFNHGYTRVSANPTVEYLGIDTPVRLRMFDPVDSGRRPVYVVTQGNEAIYMQLQPEQVYAWLTELGVTDLPAWAPSDSVRLGGRVLEAAEPFGRYFSLLKKDDARTYRYVYTLLHSYAHTLMKGIAEFSGLDVGSLGEYVFPADLAFVVYRNGTTMDLGNLSSLWRNENNTFLRHLLEPMTHRCNSGSLCDIKGGACPDCIMVPETSCIAQNRLLSRAVLAGGTAPSEDLTHQGQRIRGFLEVVNGTTA